MVFYSFDENDTKRQECEIKDIKHENRKLKIDFKRRLNVYIICFIIFCLLVLLGFRTNYLGALLFIVICILAVGLVCFFQFTELEYDDNKEQLLIKKWYGTLKIPKDRIEKIYVKSGNSFRMHAGINIYICYFNKYGNEKCFIWDINLLENQDIKDFLDIFII